MLSETEAEALFKLGFKLSVQSMRKKCTWRTSMSIKMLPG